MIRKIDFFCFILHQFYLLCLHWNLRLFYFHFFLSYPLSCLPLIWFSFISSFILFLFFLILLPLSLPFSFSFSSNSRLTLSLYPSSSNLHFPHSLSHSLSLSFSLSLFQLSVLLCSYFCECLCVRISVENSLTLYFNSVPSQDLFPLHFLSILHEGLIGIERNVDEDVSEC